MFVPWSLPAQAGPRCSLGIFFTAVYDCEDLSQRETMGLPPNAAVSGLFLMRKLAW